MSQTPRTDNFKSQGREWLPLGIFEKEERENTILREALKSALLRCNHGHDEDQDRCLCWECEDDRKALDSQANAKSAGTDASEKNL